MGVPPNATGGGNSTARETIIKQRYRWNWVREARTRSGTTLCIRSMTIQKDIPTTTPMSLIGRVCSSMLLVVSGVGV